MDTKRLIAGFPSWFIPYPDTRAQWIHYLSSIKDFITVAAQCSDLKAVICYNYQAAAFVRVMKYCRQNNIKVMADCTEWYSTKGSSLAYKILKGLDSLLRMRLIHKRVDGLMVISKYLESYYVKNDCLIRIPPLVDLEEEKWRAGSEQESCPVKFVYAGSPGGKQKDKLDLLIQAFYELDPNYDFRFIIVGISREKHLQHYGEQAGLLDVLGEKVRFLGRLSHIESLEQVKGADFTIFMREDTRVNKAGFPTKFVESISCGVPVITNKTSDLSDYLRDGENGFWLEGDIAATLQRILNMEKSQLQKMKQRIERATFDYHAYVEELAVWLELEPQYPTEVLCADAGRKTKSDAALYYASQD
ncbi:MAG TPA: glycosyltransferase [Syntrophomonadaceae bacterium]|jgi:glycosyltransferase involved in cell wall biosynthesis|nr:glycosyltransferase [Syntrophomonadaceae bacterium]